MAIYNSSYIGTASNRVTFNGFDASPVFRVLARQPQRRQIRDLDLPIPFESGISDYRTLIGETAYVIEGVIYPGSEAESDAALRSLRRMASLDVSQDDNSADGGYVPYVWTESNNNQKMIFMKVLYVDIKETTRKGLVQDFRLICKIKDPTIHGASLKTMSTVDADPSTSSGSAIHAFEYPIIYGASTYSVSDTASNDGDIPAYPQSIVINGPVNSPQVTNTTTGEFITVSENLATSSDQLIIFYDKDSLSVELNGTNVLGSVTDNSTFFKLARGGNTIELTGSSIGSGAYVQVTFYDAQPLS
jgi:hypothetical protein